MIRPVRRRPRARAAASPSTKAAGIDLGVYPVAAVDPTGAGDAFDAFLCGRLEGRPLEERARLATAAAVLDTAAFGPMESDIRPETVSRLMQQPVR
jgi:tagatose kinase